LRFISKFSARELREERKFPELVIISQKKKIIIIKKKRRRSTDK